MIDKRFMVIFLGVFFALSLSGLLIFHFYFKETGCAGRKAIDLASNYADVELVMPVSAFLRRGVNSSQVSMVRRIFMNQWVSANQGDLVKLVVYGQGAQTFEELKTALLAGVEKEGECNGAASFVKTAISTIEENKDMIEHVNKSLKEGYDPGLHTLRGQLINLPDDSSEYCALRAEYQKQLDIWMDKKHGALLDEIISRV